MWKSLSVSLDSSQTCQSFPPSSIYICLRFYSSLRSMLGHRMWKNSQLSSPSVEQSCVLSVPWVSSINHCDNVQVNNPFYLFFFLLCPLSLSPPLEITSQTNYKHLDLFLQVRFQGNPSYYTYSEQLHVIQSYSEGESGIQLTPDSMV